MTTAWAIRDWDSVFTCRQAAGVKVWRWVPWPIKLQGEGYRILASTEKGLFALGVFAALVEVAANLPRRGVLANESGPLNAVRLGLITGIPHPLITEAVAILAGPDIRWLVPDPGPTPEMTANRPGSVSESPKSVISAFPPSHSPQAEQKRDRDRDREVRLPSAQDARKPLAEAAPPDRVVLVPDLPACLPGIELAGLLAQLGVDEPMRSRLVDAGVTVAQVQDAHAAAKRGEPRRWRAVMIADLKRRVGLERGGAAAAVGAGMSREAERFGQELSRLRKARGIE